MSANFEESMDEMKKMSPREREAKIRELDTLCICPRCPTYVGTGETKRTFCLRGKSNIIKAPKGCLCPSCPIQSQLGLKWMYYCMRGSGMEQAGMK